MRRNVITVRNVAKPERVITVKDWSLPGGRVEIAPQDEYSFDRLTWRRIYRRYSYQLVDVEAIERSAVEAPVDDVETPAVETSQAEASRPLADFNMAELKSLAKSVGVCAKPTMKKTELIAAIQAAKEAT